MARPLRIQYPNAFYHITSRGNEKRRIFTSDRDCEKFKEYLAQAQEKFGFILHGYVLMRNHYHLIGETPRANLAAVMHFINGSYTTYFNVKRKRSGHLFHGRYKAIVIDQDSYLLELSRYIHLNPVRSKTVMRPEDHLYSSYRAYINKTEKDIVYRDLIWGLLSPPAYKRFVESGLKRLPESPLTNLFGGSILGEKAFIEGVLKKIDTKKALSKDVSYRKPFKHSVPYQSIIKIVAAHFNISSREAGEGVHRNLVIYLMKKYTDMPNKEIGALFGDITYSAVAKVFGRFRESLATGGKFSGEVAKLEKQLSHVKGKPPV